MLTRLAARCFFGAWISTAGLAVLCSAADQPQYEHADISIPKAGPEESKLAQLSVPLAVEYLEKGTIAWNGQRKCITCHTNGTYMTVRPALTTKLGKPSDATREYFLETLKSFAIEDRAKLKQSTRPAQVIYLAAGLAEWDAHVTKKLTAETEQALSLMFEIQLDTGTWGTLDCWPPYESDAFHEATVAAMAAATAPGWLKKIADSKDDKNLAAVEKLRTYLRTQPAPHDYSRTLLLWANNRMPGLVDDSGKQELIAMLLKQQRDDGGWSIRTFATPDKWGKGNREKKLKDEPEFAAPPSDGHMTGLAIIVLREAGVSASDARLQKGIAWLKSNQRASGRWWTRSLNTDSWHFITYSGTAFPLLALQMCDALP
jgi:squalene-hopene/tetraprenyl-beta-curcumene cyclase